jgi:hypothetical protein
MRVTNSMPLGRGTFLPVDTVYSVQTLKAKYSTPVEYTDAKHAEALLWPVKDDDFMTIAQDWPEESGLRGHMYWVRGPSLTLTPSLILTLTLSLILTLTVPYS